MPNSQVSTVGHVDVGTTGGQHESPLPKLIGDLRRAYGRVTVRIKEYRSETDVARAVRDGTVELGFGFLEPTDSGEPTDRRDLDTHNRAPSQLCVALPREIADGLPDPLPFDQIPDLPVIAVTGGAPAVVPRAGRSGVRVTPRITTDNARCRHSASPSVRTAGRRRCRNGMAPLWYSSTILARRVSLPAPWNRR